jgi:hypothetical protein
MIMSDKLEQKLKEWIGRLSRNSPGGTEDKHMRLSVMIVGLHAEVLTQDLLYFH